MGQHLLHRIFSWRLLIAALLAGPALLAAPAAASSDENAGMSENATQLVGALRAMAAGAPVCLDDMRAYLAGTRYRIRFQHDGVTWYSAPWTEAEDPAPVDSEASDAASDDTPAAELTRIAALIGCLTRRVAELTQAAAASAADKDSGDQQAVAEIEGPEIGNRRDTGSMSASGGGGSSLPPTGFPTPPSPGSQLLCMQLWYAATLDPGAHTAAREAGCLTPTLENVLSYFETPSPQIDPWPRIKSWPQIDPWPRIESWPPTRQQWLPEQTGLPDQAGLGTTLTIQYPPVYGPVDLDAVMERIERAQESQTHDWWQGFAVSTMTAGFASDCSCPGSDGK